MTTLLALWHWFRVFLEIVGALTILAALLGTYLIYVIAKADHALADYRDEGMISG